MQIQRINRDDPERIFLNVIAENAVVEGDVVQWSDTDSTTYPVGIAVEDSVANDMRVAGVITKTQATAGGATILQIYGYNDNITTDGAVASTDKVLRAGAAVAVGATEAEIITDITTADYSRLRDIFAWNIKTDSGTVGEGFIMTMGIGM